MDPGSSYMNNQFGGDGGQGHPGQLHQSNEQGGVYDAGESHAHA